MSLTLEGSAKTILACIVFKRITIVILDTSGIVY
jgi:hypothetical protein